MLIQLTLLVILSLSALCGVSQASHLDSQHRQATRAQIIDRRHALHRRDPVPSSGTCASGTKDGNNNCCKTTAFVVIDSKSCCLENAYLSCMAESNGQTELDSCCGDGGVLYPVTSTRNDCCPATSEVQGSSCVPRTLGKVKRDTVMLQDYPSEDPLRTMTFRDDSHRGILSPHLVADWIINNFEIEWQGQTYATKQYQQLHSNWRNRVAAGIGGTIGKYAGPYLIGDKLKKMYESGQEYFELGHEWAIHLDDMPDVFAALVEHENWKGHVMLGASTWDTETFRNVLTKHPKWNTTLHDRR